MQRQNKKQHLNFRKAEKVQVLKSNEWFDFSRACGSKQVVEFALLAEKMYGFGNVRIVKI
jgi:hypothetical protein